MNKQKKGLFTKFIKCKQAVNIEELKEEQEILLQQQEEFKKSINELGDDDMPNLATLNEDSDYSMFLSDKVSNVLRKKALKKLFLSSSINVLDGLNDYDENYTSFELLGNIIPYDLKQQLALKSKEAAEKILKSKKENLKEQDKKKNKIQVTKNNTLKIKID